MKKADQSQHDYKDCRLDFEKDYVHIVQKGVFETDVYYQNIEGLTYQYRSQTITITQNNSQVLISTSNEKDYGPIAKILMILGALLLTAAIGYIFMYRNYLEYFTEFFNDLADRPFLEYIAFLCLAGGLLTLIIGTIMLVTRKQRPNFKIGYDELNSRYHEIQDENVTLRKSKLEDPFDNMLK